MRSVERQTKAYALEICLRVVLGPTVRTGRGADGVGYQFGYDKFHGVGD
jgi:hypothetical protein